MCLEFGDKSYWKAAGDRKRNEGIILRWILGIYVVMVGGKQQTLVLIFFILSVWAVFELWFSWRFINSHITQDRGDVSLNQNNITGSWVTTNIFVVPFPSNPHNSINLCEERSVCKMKSKTSGRPSAYAPCHTHVWKSGGTVPQIRYRWASIFTFRPLHAQGDSIRHPVGRRIDAPQRWFGFGGEGKAGVFSFSLPTVGRHFTK